MMDELVAASARVTEIGFAAEDAAMHALTDYIQKHSANEKERVVAIAVALGVMRWKIEATQRAMSKVHPKLAALTDSVVKAAEHRLNEHFDAFMMEEAKNLGLLDDEPVRKS